jgi:cytochrome c peroxidase
MRAAAAMAIPVVAAALAAFAGVAPDGAASAGAPPAATAASGADAPPWQWRLPAGFPTPRVPPDNPMSEAKVALGRRLFHDRRLSLNRTQACSDCHQQQRAFTDGRAHALGSTGETHRRSAMSLANVAYGVSFTWADPNVRRLEDQILIPLLGTHPVELGMGGQEAELKARLESAPPYVELFATAFPGESRPINVSNVARAIACFERTLISGDSPYDQVVFQGKMDAMTGAAWRGMRLFFSDRLACSRCHAGFNFSRPVDYVGTEGFGRPPEPLFHNTGLYDLDGHGAYPAADTGLRDVTGRRRDVGKFKAPTLRNIALTAPYMHDGSVATLAEAIDHYAHGGRAGDGSRTKSPLLTGFVLADDEKRDLIEFLGSLTDTAFVSDPRFADPWGPEPGAGGATAGDTAGATGAADGPACRMTP